MKTTALMITKTLTFQPEDPPRPLGKYVFQRVAPGRGNVTTRTRRDLQIRVHVIPFDPMTPAQIARRDLFRAAVARWRAPVGDDMARWKRIALNRSIPVFNAALSDILRNYHLDGLVLVKN